MVSEAVDSFSSKVSLNVLTNIIRTVIMALVGFMMVPYYLGEFGLATYAIIPLITSITTYFLAISDSLANAFTRYMVISIQEGDEDVINRTFSSSVIGMAKCIGLLMPLVLAISIASPYIFSRGDAGLLSVQLAFFMVLSSTLMISFSACMSSVFMAFNRMYITYIGRIVHSVLQVGLVLVFFVLRGPSLELIGVSYVLSSLVFLLIMAVYLRRVCPTLRLSYSYYDPVLLKRIGGLGIWAIVVEFGSLMFIQASMVVVNLMLGSEIQGSFSIAANMISMINTACTSIAAASTPLVYRSYAKGDLEGMVRTLGVFTKFSGLLMAFPIAYVMVFMSQILGVWIGSGYEEIYPILAIMLPIEVVVCVVNSLIVVPIVCEKLRAVAFVTVILGIANVVLSVLFILFTDWGVMGVCVSWVITTALQKMVFYPVYSSMLTSDSRTKYISPIVYSIIAFVVLLIMGMAVTHAYTLPTSWAAIIISFFLCFIIYFLFAMRFLFDRDEKTLIRSFLPGFVQRFVNV